MAFSSLLSENTISLYENPPKLTTLMPFQREGARNFIIFEKGRGWYIKLLPSKQNQRVVLILSYCNLRDRWKCFLPEWHWFCSQRYRNHRTSLGSGIPLNKLERKYHIRLCRSHSNSAPHRNRYHSTPPPVDSGW